MYEEQRAIIFSFGITAFFIGVTIIGIYFINMTLEAATISTAITVGGMFWWYHSALRIYNRFWFDKKNAMDDDDQNDSDERFADPDKQFNDLHAKLLNKKKKEPAGNRGKPSFLQRFAGSGVKSKVGSRSSKSSSKSATSKLSTIFGGQGSEDNSEFGIQGDEEEDDAASYKEFVDVDRDSSRTPSVNSEVKYSGNLSMKIDGMFGKKKWVLRYFVLQGAEMFYYKNKLEFEQHQNPINDRYVCA